MRHKNDVVAPTIPRRNVGLKDVRASFAFGGAKRGKMAASRKWGGYSRCSV